MASWSEEKLSRIDFLTMLQQDEFWKDHEGGVDAALSGGKDILRLAQAQSSAPEVVLLAEGYAKQQPSALDKQLPLSARAKELPLPPAPPLFWTPSAGDPEARVPVGVMERCKLLEVQYILKQYQPPAQPPKSPADQPDAAAAADAGGEGGGAPPAAAAAAAAAPPAAQDGDAGSDDKYDEEEEEEGMQHLWPHQRRQLKQQRRAQRAQCQRLSLRVVLQRIPQPKLEESEEEQEGEQEGEQEEQEANGHVQPAAAAAAAAGGAAPAAAAVPDDNQEYTCSLEYPAFTLGSSDYLVAGEVYDRGIKTWQTLQNGDAFTMLWDGEPYKGFALGYRHRKLSDPYFGSPWWSVAVGWENHGTDRRSDPEDWCFGNPWEMNRPPGHEIQPLPDTAQAMFAGHKAGRAVQAAPWTRVGRKAARAAAERANARRARPGGVSHNNDFVYDSNDEDGDPDAEDWDPTENFPSEDDADEFELHAGRRRRAGRAGQQNGSRSASRRRAAGVRRTGSEGPPGEGNEAGGPAPPGKGASTAKAKKKAAAGADGKDGDLTHNYGRDMVLPEGVCLVCRQRDGVLVNGHTGRTGGGCSRQYHAGCLLMLQAAGIRSLILTKGAGAGGKQQRKGGGGSQAKSPAGGGPVVASDVQQLCDGLLGELQGQLQQPNHGLSAATVAAVATAETAAQMVVNGQVALTCPAHSCHGCLLNGKHEFMVWCCCCYVRVYHHRNCVPYGAEHIQLGGRDFIRCPHCVAANVLPKAARIKRPAASTATAAASVGGGGGADSAAAGGGRAAASAAAAASGAGPSGAAAAAEPTPNSGMDVAELLDLLAGAAAAAEADGGGGGGGGGADGDDMDVDGAAGNNGPAPACGCGHDDDAGHAGHAAAAAAAGGPPAPAAAPAAPPGPPQLLTSASSANAGQIDALAEAKRPLGVGAAVAAVAAEAAAFAAGGAVAAAANGGQPGGMLLPLFKQEQPQQVASTAGAADGDTVMAEGDPAPAQQQQQTTFKLEVLQPPSHARPSMLMSSLQQQLSPKPPRPPPPPQQQQQRQHSLMQMEDEIQLLHQRRQQQQQQRPAASGSTMPAASEADTGVDEDDARYGGAASGQPRDDEGSVDDDADAGGESEGWGLQPGIIPAWLQLAIEDEERRSPSYQLVQCGEDGGALDVDDPLASRAAIDPSTRRPVLCITAAAARSMPPLPPVGGAAAAAAAGAAFADDDDEPALPLASPHCNWLVGSRTKAEAVYKVANSWGVPIIGVPLAADDSVYGLSVVVDHLPALRQCAAAAGLLGGDAAAAEAAAAATGARRARPGIYLRCNRVVTQSGELQSPSQPPADGSAAESARGRSGKEWQVMVNGEAYPARQGRQGVELQLGDVVTVQGLSFKLELA